MLHLLDQQVIVKEYFCFQPNFNKSGLVCQAAARFREKESGVCGRQLDQKECAVHIASGAFWSQLHWMRLAIFPLWFLELIHAALWFVEVLGPSKVYFSYSCIDKYFYFIFILPLSLHKHIRSSKLKMLLEILENCEKACSMLTECHAQIMRLDKGSPPANRSLFIHISAVILLSGSGLRNSSSHQNLVRQTHLRVSSSLGVLINKSATTLQNLTKSTAYKGVVQTLSFHF